MQLFIIDFEQNGDTITINNKEIAHQIKKVLRMKAGDLFFVQIPISDYNTETIRYQVKIENIESSTVTGIITKRETNSIKDQNNNKNIETTIAIAMPNKRSKAELITQKLSELGINKIYFRPAERSIIKDSKDKKIDRLVKISQEATEQSRGRTLSTVNFIKDINTITQNSDTKIIVFDKSNNINISTDSLEDCPIKNKILGIIGPEGGLTPKDYEKIGENYTTQTIGDTILRTETASIIAGWIIKSID